ncbi:MAG TPA: Uma2 family endonuclease [Thermoanaerobaculia bacterium]|nr:Uma2 family endonuclease [Thermoanaerobaculia bacterium]
MCAMPLEREIEYPTSDGQPMAETTLHREVMSDIIGGLERHYADVPDVWIGGNLFLYYRKGDPSACIAPDVLLVKGVTKWKRPTYLLWEEGPPPALVFEITSQSTRREDQNKKRKTCQMLGVEELVLFDPYGEYLKPRLQGYRLDGQGIYQPIPLNIDGSLDSRTTGLKIRPEGERLRLVDPATGRPLLWNDELDVARLAAEKRAEEATAARQAAELRLRALEEELARLHPRDQ